METKTIQQRIAEIINILKSQKQLAFMELCATDKAKVELILTFLSILELARVGAIRLFQHQATKALTLFFVDDSKVNEIEDSYQSFPYVEPAGRPDEEVS